MRLRPTHVHLDVSHSGGNFLSIQGFALDHPVEGAVACLRDDFKTSDLVHDDTCSFLMACVLNLAEVHGYVIDCDLVALRRKVDRAWRKWLGVRMAFDREKRAAT